MRGALRFTGVVVLLLVISSSSFAQKDKTKPNKLPPGCADGQVAKWNADPNDSAFETWVCAEDIDTTTNITALQAQVDTNTADIATNATAIASNLAVIATNTTAIGTNATNIATNTTAIGTNATNIAANTTAINDLTTRVSDLDSSSSNPDPACFDNSNRYVDCGNGTVTDTVTRLIWLQNGSCLGVFLFRDWTGMNDLAAGLADGQCGLTDGSKPGDWRLPTKDEWVATMDRALALGCTMPDDPTQFGKALTDRAGTGCFLTDANPVFSGVQDFYWASVADETFPDRAWGVDLRDGFRGTFSKDSLGFGGVGWPVRGGQ